MSQPQVCTVDDGLINPAALPAKAADLDTNKITGAADDLRTMGTTVDSTADEIKSIWSGLGGCYQAPEQATVYALMDRPATASEKVKTTFTAMAGHLDTYADALATIKSTLADFERRAQEFRDDVIDGVWVNATEAADAGIEDHAKAFGNWFMGNEQERKKVPWYEDGDTVAKNEAFVKEIGGIYAKVSAAAAACATSINGLTSLPLEEQQIKGIPEQSFYDPASPMPWGAPREEDRNCPESVGHGAYQFGKNTLEGLGQLISYNPETGDWGDWGHAGQAWMGTGNVLLSLAVTGIGTIGFTQLMKAGGNGDNPVVKWLDERHQVATGVVTGLVGIDLNAKDPFHKWKQDGVATFTESFLNVGTMFIPGAGQAGAAVKVAGLGSKLARVTGAVADFAVPGGSWLVKGGMHTIPVLRNVAKFGDNLPVNLLDDVAKTPKLPGVNPVSLADDVAPAGARPPARPVTNDLFGNGPEPVRPDAAAPRTTTADPELPPERTTGVRHDTAEAPRVVELSSVGAPSASGAAAHSVSDAAHHVDGGAASHAPGTANHAASGTASHPETGAPHPEGTSPHAETGDAHPAGTPAEHGAHPAQASTHADGTSDHAGTHHADGDPRPTTAPDATPHERPEGFPAQDRHGREYTFDSEGRAHLKDDPANSYRDRNGQLHDETTGNFVKDTNRGDPTEHRYAEKGTTADVDLDWDARTDHDQLVKERTAAEDLAHDVSQDLDLAAVRAGVDPEPLRGSTDDVAAYLDELLDLGDIDAATADALRDAAERRSVAYQELREASEKLGDQATQAVINKHGETTLIPPEASGANRVDALSVGVDGDGPYITFTEGKGGNSPLGFRTEDGVRVQQGTSEYLNAISRVDPRVAEQIRWYADTFPESEIGKAINNGTIRIRFELVQALPNGRVKLTPFVLDAGALKVPGIGRG